MPCGLSVQCVAEEIFSTECLLRLSLPPMDRPKCVSLLEDGHAVENVPGGTRQMHEVEQKLGNAKFTGKGDQKDVVRLYYLYQRRLDEAGLG